MLVTFLSSFPPATPSLFLFLCSSSQRFMFDACCVLGQASECVCLIHCLSLIQTDKHYIFHVVSLVGHTQWLASGICE